MNDVVHLNTFSIISYIIGLAGIGGGIYGFFRFSDYKVTVRLQNDKIKALEGQAETFRQDLETSQKAHAESMRVISNLEGKIEAYKDIPIQEIRNSLASLAASSAGLADSNQQILSTLKNSAIIAATDATDGGLLVKTEKTITVPGK